METVAGGRFVEFGPFRFDALNRVLLRDGTELPLPPRVLALLECLLERPGVIISRQELIDRVWRDSFVTDTSLAEAVSFLRQTLGDDPQSPTYVQTIHRRGYRFLAPVQPEPAGAPSVEADSPGIRVTPDIGRDALSDADVRGAARPVERERVRPSIAGELLPWSLVVLLAAIGTVAIWKLTHPPVAAQPHVTRFRLALPAGISLRADASPAALSSDGRMIALSGCEGSGACRLYLRDLAQLMPRAVHGTGDAAAPFFSPDGRWVGFFADGKLKKTPAGGGASVVLCDAPTPFGAAWLDDGTIVFSARDFGGLEAVSENGGAPYQYTRPNAAAGELGHRWPTWMPGGRYLLFTATTAPADRGADRAMALLPAERQPRAVTGRATGIRFVAPGIVAFARGGELHAARFDPSQGALSTTPVRIGGDLLPVADGAPVLASSAGGTLLQVAGAPASPALEIVDASGRRSLAAAVASLHEPALDPAGRRITGLVPEGIRSDVWIADVVRGTMTRLTHDSAAASPVWSRDGRRVVFSSSAGGPYNLWVADPEHPSAVRLLTSPAHQFPTAMSASLVVFTQYDPQTRGDIWMVDADQPGAARPLVRTPFDEGDGAVSPDGRWLAYRSDESGRWQVYVRAVGGGARTVVSTEAAWRPWWEADGRLLYFTSRGVHQVAMRNDGTPAASTGLLRWPGGSVVTASGTGVYLLRPVARELPAPTVTIEAWQEISRALPPAVTSLPR